MNDLHLLYEQRSEVVRAILSLGSLAQLRGFPIPIFCANHPVPGFPYIPEQIHHRAWHAPWKTPWGKARVVWSDEEAGPLASLRPFLYLEEDSTPLRNASLRTQLGHAVMDLATGWISVYVDDEPVYHCTVETQGAHIIDIHRGLLRELAEKNIPVYPSCLYGWFSKPFPYTKDTSWGVWIPCVTNGQVTCPLVGFAICEFKLVYINVVGHKSAIKSIRATAYQGKDLTITRAAGYSQTVATHKCYRSFLTPTPIEGVHRMILVDRRAVDNDLNDDLAFLVLPKARAEESNDLGIVFAEKLDHLIPIPVLPEWGEVLLHQGIGNGLVRKIVAEGDVWGIALRTNTEAWSKLIGELLREKTIRL